MQLLGIYITGTQKGVTKILERGWFPFGNYKKPALGKTVRVIDNKETRTAKSIYQREGLPEISVNCIAGVNGAGKSTLLDIFYRMINNFAYRMLGAQRVKSTGRDLHYARGVYADLFFICEGAQYKLSCRDIQTTLYKNEVGDTFRLVTIKDTDDPKSILRSFFYTISTNYSLYAFNEKEYEPDGDLNNLGINGDWLRGLFHKNDGYYTPIVITPYRDKGVIDVEKENILAAQRVMVLALLAKAQGNTFFTQYDPHAIEYRLDTGYKERTESKFRVKVFKDYNFDVSPIIRAFEFAWEKVFESLYYDVQIEESSKDEHYLALFYLAYKTVKICLTYDDYKKKLNIDALVSATNKTESELNKELSKITGVVIKKIIDEIDNHRDNRSHITLKLSVCLDYMHSIYQHNTKWKTRSRIEVSELIRDKRIKSYNDAVLALPPAFYTMELKFKAKDAFDNPLDSSWSRWIEHGEDVDFTINKMSSGERQMLYSLSYVLYHIKNIQSIQEDENRVAYHNICLIFDEAELYFHPDFQRRFLSMLFEAITWCNINPEIIHSIQVLIVTHSPFILTDMLTQNTLYLEGGTPHKVLQQSFGGNYYDLLRGSFFFSKRAVGNVSADYMAQLINRANKGECVTSEEITLVGDVFIRRYLENKNHVQD